jgi:actin-like ATPase involved in cell morphogenesis
MAIGFDVGTYNLVCCQRDEKGNFVNHREINAFIELPLENRFVFDMMKEAGAPLIEREDMAYVCGEAAVNMAYTISQIELKRPMSGGCVNPKERDAFQILSIMIHSLLSNVKQDNETLYYCVPANAINEETDADYHTKVLEAIFKAYESEKGYKVNAHPINEALALVYAELGKKSYTGIGISFGAGMVNLCFSMYGNPLFKFAIVNSGDWIDKQAAKATSTTPTFINKEKTKVDLGKEPTNMIERAVQTQYRIMIEHTVNEIKKGLSSTNKAVNSDTPVDIVIAGGTSSPPGFDKLFRDIIMQAKLPIKVGDVIRPEDPLYSVARGCLIAAENAR